MGFELVLFLALGGLAVLFAVGMLLSENAVHSALFLIGNFGVVAILFLMLDAPFIGMVQIVVYTGAIMVLFLFVIMLLGAEKTTDTTRRFRWLTGLATTLALAFLIAVALPIVISTYEAPERFEDDPMLRIAHAADLPTPVTIQITGESLSEPLVLSDVAFGDVTDFFSVPPGEYTVQISNTPTSLEEFIEPLQQQFALEDGDIFTALAYGRFRIDGEQSFTLALESNSLAAVGEDGARLQAFNAYVDEPLTLVDLGPNDVLDTGTRQVTTGEGEEAQTVTEDFILDTVVIDNVAFGAFSDDVTYEEGVHTLAFINADGEEVARLREWDINRDTEQMLVLVPDAEALLTPGEAARPLVLGGLTLNVSPSFGSPMGIGQILFTDYLLPVNLVGMLLLVAMIGVIVLTRPEGEMIPSRKVLRRKVSRPLVSVISQQTGHGVAEETPRLEQPEGTD